MWKPLFDPVNRPRIAHRTSYAITELLLSHKIPTLKSSISKNSHCYHEKKNTKSILICHKKLYIPVLLYIGTLHSSNPNKPITESTFAQSKPNI